MGSYCKNLVTVSLQKWASMCTRSPFRLFCWWRSVVRAFSTSTTRNLGQFCRYSTNQYSFNHASCFCPGVTFYWYCIFICFIQSIAAVIFFFYFAIVNFVNASSLFYRTWNSALCLKVCYHWNVSLKVLADFLSNYSMKFWKFSAPGNIFAWLS